jgi:hypothetical protein
MHKTTMLALGAGLLAVAALQVPDAALAARKGIAATAPTSPRKPPPTARQAGVKKCHYPSTIYPATKTPMSALPPPGACFGGIVKGAYCLTCTGGGAPDPYIGKCFRCQAGYYYSGGHAQCCRGSRPPLPTPK